MITNRVDAWLKTGRERLDRLLWPPQCVLCGRAGQTPATDLCLECERDLPMNDTACAICAHPLIDIELRQRVCGACLRKRPRFDATLTPFRYAYPMDHLVRRLKYSGALVHSRVLGELFARIAARRVSQSPPELLVPVPLAQRRFQSRGFNQALELARHIHRRLDVPLRTDVLVRTRETLVQAGLDHRERRKNIRGAFALTRPLAARHVAIIDDVVTTGSTANEIARVLKRAGVARVDVWAIARAAR